MENETKTEKSETIIVTKEELNTLLHSVGKLQRKFELIAQKLFTQADKLKPSDETAHRSSTVDFGGICYLGAAAEMEAVYMGIARLGDRGSWTFDQNRLHYFD